MPLVEMTIGEITRLIPFTIKFDEGNDIRCKFCGGRYVICHLTFELIHGCKVGCFVEKLRIAGKAK